MYERARWNERYTRGQGPTQPNERLPKYLHRLRGGRVLDVASGLGQNARLFTDSTVVRVDISDEALARATGLRVLADAGALPFPSNSFDTIVCTYFFDPTIDFASLLVTGGTLFLETYTMADEKYRPAFPAAYRLNPERLGEVFRGLERVLWEETDDGSRVFGTFIGRKPHVA